MRAQAPTQRRDSSISRQDSPFFKRIAILGTGLIGGSFGLAVRELARPEGLGDLRVTGWDRAGVLERAVAMGAVTDGTGDLEEAVRGSDLVYIALPVGTAMEVLPAVARGAGPGALVTDAGGTKVAMCGLAAKVFGGEHGGEEGGARGEGRGLRESRFLGGHPVAGKEVGGVENASAELFEGARYALVVEQGEDDERVRAFVDVVRGMGARPVFLDAETHDWAAAIVSHLPQLVSVALAGMVEDESDESEDSGEGGESGAGDEKALPVSLPVSLAGKGLRDMLRLAGSPYEVWRDICLTNGTNISRALDRLAQQIDYLRTHLASKELATEFEAANRVYKALRGMQ